MDYTDTFLEGWEPKPQKQEPNTNEPRVFTRHVADVLYKVVRPDDDDAGASVALIAEKANTSTRTVYRVLSCSTHTISLDLADRLCLAAHSHLAERPCWLLMSDGSEEPYCEGNGIL